MTGWVAEFSSARSRKLRTGQIAMPHRAEALAMLARLNLESFTTLPVGRAQFRTAVRFADQHGLTLRRRRAAPRGLRRPRGHPPARWAGGSAKPVQRWA